MPFHVPLSLKVVTHANCMIERGKFCTTKPWKAGSPLAYLTTRFVLRIMRTLQAVWVFCLKIPTRDSFKPLWLPVSGPCRAQVWFCCSVSCYSYLLGPVCHSWEHPQCCEKSAHSGHTLLGASL